MKQIIYLIIGLLMISIVNAEWQQRSNIIIDNIQTDENIQFDYHLKLNEIQFNITTLNKFDLAICVPNFNLLSLYRLKGDILEDVKPKSIKFLLGWCTDYDNWGYGKQDEDPNKAKYQLNFQDGNNGFKLYAGKGNHIAEVKQYNLDIWQDKESEQINVTIKNDSIITNYTINDIYKLIN